MSQVSAQQLDRLELNIIFAIDEIQKDKRQYINKHIQNSLNNYFLENYCVLDLKKKFEIHSGRQIKNLIQDKYQLSNQFNSLNLNFPTDQHSSLKKYYILLLGFLEEHLANGTLDDYRQAMLNIINEELPSYSESEASIDNTQEWISPFIFYKNDQDKVNKWVQLQWKKLIALFVLHHSYHPTIEAIYQIWFDIFQNRIVDASTQKKKKPENNRLYKYQDLPYVLNNDYYSSQPLVIPKNEEISIAQKKKLKSFKSQAQVKENGTNNQKSCQQNGQKQALKQTKYRITLIDQQSQQLDCDIEKKNTGENKSSKDTKQEERISKEYVQQNLSDNQVIEKKPYKKLKQGTNKEQISSDYHKNTLSSMINIQIIQKSSNPQVGQSIHPQKETKDYRNVQVICQQSETGDKPQSQQTFKQFQSKKEPTNNLTKDFFAQQTQSAFSKYNKREIQNIQQKAKNTFDLNQNQTNFEIKKESNLIKKETNNCFSPKAVISLVPTTDSLELQNAAILDICSKQFIKNEDLDSSNCQQEKQNEQSTCEHSQNILQSPVSQAQQIPFSKIPINSFQYQVGNLLNTQSAVHYQQQPVQVMFQPYITHQQINQFVHPNQISSNQSVIPIINLNNMPFVPVPLNYISMISPNCPPTATQFINLQQF